MTGRTDGIGGEVPAGLVSWVEPSAERTDVQGEGLVWHTSTLTMKFRRCAPIFIFKKIDMFIVLAGWARDALTYTHEALNSLSLRLDARFSLFQTEEVRRPSLGMAVQFIRWDAAG